MRFRATSILIGRAFSPQYFLPELSWGAAPDGALGFNFPGALPQAGMGRADGALGFNCFACAASALSKVEKYQAPGLITTAALIASITP